MYLTETIPPTYVKYGGKRLFLFPEVSLFGGRK